MCATHLGCSRRNAHKLPAMAVGEANRCLTCSASSAKELAMGCCWVAMGCCWVAMGCCWVAMGCWGWRGRLDLEGGGGEGGWGGGGGGGGGGGWGGGGGGRPTG